MQKTKILQTLSPSNSNHYKAAHSRYHIIYSILRMQAAVAAMAIHTLLTVTVSPSSHTLLSKFPSHSSYPLHSSFNGVSLKLPLGSNLTLSAVAPKPFVVVAATKKAVAVLKGDSNVEGVVTLTQESDGRFLCFNSFFFITFYLN